MRKHPLIALTAFTALTASAIAGASTGTFDSNSVLTSARVSHPHEATASRAAPTEPMALSSRDLGLPWSFRRGGLVVLNDANRLQRLHLDSLTGLRTGAERHPRLRPAPVEAPPAPVQPVAPPPAPAPVVTTTTAPPAPAGGVWYELRMCESNDDYSANTGNGYYGAYQFALSTWYSLGFTGLPSDASPATQDRAAEELQAEDGWGQWPLCSAELGL